MLSWITWGWVRKPHTEGKRKKGRKISSLWELFTSAAVKQSIHHLCGWTQALLEEDGFLIRMCGFFTDHIKGGLTVRGFIQKQWIYHHWGHFAIAPAKVQCWTYSQDHQPDQELPRGIWTQLHPAQTINYLGNHYEEETQYPAAETGKGISLLKWKSF